MNKRKTIITVVCVFLVLALAAAGIAYAVNPERTTCNVYAVSDLAMENWDDGNITYGEVRSDQVQTVYLSDTQQVTEVYVKEGQSVQKGDKLLAYDTTLSSLEVSRKEIEIKQMKEELTAAKKEYNTLAGSKVYTVAADKIEGAPVQLAIEPAAKSAEPTYRLTFLTNVTETPAVGEQPGEEVEEELPAVDENGVVRTYALQSGTGTQEDPYLYVCADGIPFNEDFLREIGLLPKEGEEVIPPAEGEVPPEEEDPAPVYVVFGISEGNNLKGKILQAGGMCFSLKDDKVSFIVFDASDYIGRAFGEPKPEPDPPKPPEQNNDKPDNDNPNNDNPNNDKPNNDKPNNDKPNNDNPNNDKPNNDKPSGPSYAEIQAKKAELQQTIKDLDLQIRMAEVELKRMNQELSDGIVYAEMAGTISSLQEVEAAYQSGEPLMKLAGGGGYYIEGTVSELDLETVEVGQRVSVTSWESGNVYDGKIVSISSTPSENNYYYGSGNTNVSYYPFVVTIDGSADFREYESVEMKLEQEQVVSDFFYLEQPFILEEDGKSYVYVAGEEGKLEKREILTGEILWGTSFQILEGLTREDAIAFPYGKDVKEGANTELSTLDELYGW